MGEEAVHALKGISYTIEEGEFVTIMGRVGPVKVRCSIFWGVSISLLREGMP